MVGGCPESCGVTPAEAEAGSNVGRASPSLLPTAFPAPPAQVDERLSGASDSRAKTGGCFILHSALGQTVLNPARRRGCCQGRTASSCTWEASLNSCCSGGLATGGGAGGGGWFWQPVPREGSAQTSRRRGHLGRDGANLLITSPEVPLLFASPSPPHPGPWKHGLPEGRRLSRIDYHGFWRGRDHGLHKARPVYLSARPSSQGGFCYQVYYLTGEETKVQRIKWPS